MPAPEITRELVQRLEEHKDTYQSQIHTKLFRIQEYRRTGKTFLA
jgi:hypothetical protein